MGKDQSGGFHPPKGKPSGGKPEGLGISTTAPEEIEAYLERTDQYVLDDENLDPGIPVRHPNRRSGGGNDNARKPNLKETDTTIEMATASGVDTEPEQLPDTLEKELFAEMAEFRSDCCITIYLPTHQSGVEVNEKHDAILLKNTLKDIAGRLSEQGIDTARIEQLLTPAYRLLQQDRFWGRMGKGLAIFIADGYFKYLIMHVMPRHEAVCQKRFLMTPLIPLLTCKTHFYLLVINKQKCKLFRADTFGMEYIDVPGLPDEMLDVKRLSEKDASTFRPGTSSGAGGANFHGMGGGNPDHKDTIAVYFEAVDDIIYKEVLHAENAPLLLAGVEYLIPIYRAASDYHNICSESLTGSHEHDGLNQLYAQAREIMAPYFAQAREKALTIFANQKATPLTTSMVRDVIPAAYYGRVSHLFVREGAHIAGRFDEMNSILDLDHNDQEPQEDLVDMAVIKTLTQGGEVYILPEELMPSESTELAGVLRY
ncbi:hypothetical protein LZD49_29635 [Dyadobacter sp. CY261]|uniref:baeRF7 domain-containing protein n=1 Tax=Dyadobacter sp. CY261 TaxID=2907203 RepID=UPI001F3F82A3|nr:hypothetical protein [Dyadobacter sp. CY261]MCF0074684.1 hypothetical protein [Dyadobacter sp. CY261]